MFSATNSTSEINVPSTRVDVPGISSMIKVITKTPKQRHLRTVGTLVQTAVTATLKRTLVETENKPWCCPTTPKEIVKKMKKSD